MSERADFFSRVMVQRQLHPTAFAIRMCSEQWAWVREQFDPETHPTGPTADLLTDDICDRFVHVPAAVWQGCVGVFGGLAVLLDDDVPEDAFVVEWIGLEGLNGA